MAMAPARMAVPGAIAQVDLDIQSARRKQARLEAEAAVVRLPVALIDSLLGDLEVLNLVDSRRVPGSLQPSLRWLREHCPVECPELSVHMPPVCLMDMLFELQESLFALRGGDFRRRLQCEDEGRLGGSDS
jgi:hypothetical protein